MSEADRKKWEERYRKRMTEPLGPPDPFLDEILDQLPATGCAMDLAGGSGRHALVLARQGLEVTLTDVAPAGLAIARDAAAAAGLSLHTEIIDLDSDPLPPGPFAVVFCSWFLPPDERWQDIGNLLSPDGLLVLVHPTRENLERHAHPSARFCVDEHDLRAHLKRAGLRIRRATAGWDAAGKHTLRILAEPTEPTGPTSPAGQQA